MSSKTQNKLKVTPKPRVIMSRFFVPLLILLGSLLYSWFWNCERKPGCMSGEYAVQESDSSSESMAPAAEMPVAVEPDAEEEMTEAEEEELLFKPLDIYFQTANSDISRTPEIENFLATAKRYLAAHPDRKLSLIGHTDSDGSNTTNDRLSLERANVVKQLLVSEGFSENQLVTTGRGEREPKGPNDSPEGKALNRRVTIGLTQ